MLSLFVEGGGSCCPFVLVDLSVSKGHVIILYHEGPSRTRDRVCSRLSMKAKVLQTTSLVLTVLPRVLEACLERERKMKLLFPFRSVSMSWSRTMNTEKMAASLNR